MTIKVHNGQVFSIRLPEVTAQMLADGGEERVDLCKPKFHVTVNVDPATASSRATGMQFAASAAKAMARSMARAVLSDADIRKLAESFGPQPQEAKPAPLHALQRLSSQPNGFGQSLWRPWE